MSHTDVCIKIEHIGASDRRHYSLIISSYETLCGIEILYPTDKIWIKRILMNEKLFSSAVEYVKGVSFEKSEPSKGMYSGYKISLISESSVIREGYIGSYLEFRTFINGLKGEIDDERTIGELEDLDEFFGEYDFY